MTSRTVLRVLGPPSLLRRVLVANAAVLVVATAVLAFSPLTVSSPVVVTELVVLLLGLGLLLVVNAVVLRTALAPLERLSRLMGRVDLLRPGERLPVEEAGTVQHLVHSFNDMLDRLEAERSASSALALAAQEGERQRISRELHDEIGQRLTVVLLGLSRLVDQAPPDLREELAAVREDARTALEEAGAVARRLRPGVLDDLGLVSALSSLAADFTASTGVPVHRRVGPELAGLDREIDLVLYRIVQEGLTNVARHAKAQQVVLDLRRTGGLLVLEVQDDGAGLPERPREGVGMHGMRERALLVGGALHLGPGPDGGTTLRVMVPVGDAAVHREIAP